MARRPPLVPDIDDDELAAMCAAEAASALSASSGEGSTLAQERSDAISYYLGDMTQDMPVPGPDRSRAVSRDVMDVVEGVLPELIEVFTAGDDVCQFGAVGQEDEAAAKQETDVVNHVIMEENEGFKIVYDWLKDGLLTKTGFVKWFWDDRDRQEIETYYGLDDLQFVELSQDEAVQIVEHREYPDDAPPAMPEAQPLAPVEPPMLHDVVCKRAQPYAKCTIENVAPEEVGVSRFWRGGSLREAPYLNHVRKLTASDLVEMGIDRDKIDGIPEGAWDDSAEAIKRSTVDEAQAAISASIDKSQRTVTVTEHWIRIDVDDDGRSELLHVITAGNTSSGNRVLLKEFADNINMAAWSPVRMPHRGIGLSLADLVMDYQRIKTALLRVMLDNAYFTTNAVLDVPESAIGDYTIDDVLKRRPGSIIRSRGQGGQITPIVTPPLVGQLLPVLETMDARQEMRTGWSRYNQGLDGDSLNKTATGVSLIQTAAQKRQKLIAKLFAETGIKDLFLGVHETILKRDRRQRAIQLRGKWVNVNPREWKRRTDLKVSVGIGPGTQQQQIAFLQSILGLQMKALELQGSPNGPMVYLPHIHYTVGKLVETMGYRSVEPFVSEPTKPQPQLQVQLPPPPPTDAEHMARAEVEKATIGARADIEKERIKANAAIEEANIKAANDVTTTREKAAADVQKAVAVAHVDVEKAKAVEGVKAETARNGQMLDAIRSDTQVMSEGATGKTQQIVDEAKEEITGAVVDVLKSFMQAQQQRDERMSGIMEMMGRAMMAETVLEKDPKTGAKRARRVMATVQ